MNDTDKIISAITSKQEALENLDQAIIGESIGLSMTIDLLRDALNDIESALDHREFEQAALLGYTDVTSEFICMQRSMAGLNDAMSQIQQFVTEVAAETVPVYETVWPHVKDQLDCFKPKPDYTPEEREKFREKVKSRIANLSTDGSASADPEKSKP